LRKAASAQSNIFISNIKTLEDHENLVQKIYDHLADTCFYVDVNRYMSFHCLGGVVTENADKRVFVYYNKPYMFQIQAWWDDAGNPFTNESRNKEYVA
jgi:hypothetical protein